MEPQTKALNYFSTGCNCSQAVLAALSSKLNISEGMALSVSAGFGAGVCYQDQTCGAVSGAYMALGILSGTKHTQADKVKEYTYELIKEFNQKFLQSNGAITCTQLINFNLSKPDELLKARESGVFGSICPKLITQSVEIVLNQINA